MSDTHLSAQLWKRLVDDKSIDYILSYVDPSEVYIEMDENWEAWNFMPVDPQHPMSRKIMRLWSWIPVEKLLEADDIYVAVNYQLWRYDRIVIAKDEYDREHDLGWDEPQWHQIDIELIRIYHKWRTHQNHVRETARPVS